MRDIWGTVDALYAVLQSHHDWNPWALAKNTRVLVTGHSNGGQGTWHLASRYPDRVVGGKWIYLFQTLQFIHDQSL